MQAFTWRLGKVRCSGGLLHFNIGIGANLSLLPMSFKYRSMKDCSVKFFQRTPDPNASGRRGFAVGEHLIFRVWID
jgi:hypothetical protein